MAGNRHAGVIVGHSNMDLDCLGSIALARHLYPDYLALQSRHVHPVAQPLVTMYRIHLNLAPPKDLKGDAVEHLVVVDTRSRERISEYLELLSAPPGRIDVYDHHPGDSRDIPRAVFHESTYGANSTFLGVLLMEAGLRIGPDDATIALTGIFADTGNFTHPNVTEADFRVAAHLLESGASMTLVKTFLSPLRERLQVTTFHQVMNDLVFRTIQGHTILLSYTELDGPRQGLSPVVEKIFEVENPDVYFAVFFFTHNRSAVIIARNHIEDIELDRVLAGFGGGGHRKAASATVKEVEGRELFDTLLTFLESSLKPAITARDIMTRDVTVLPEEVTLLDAARLLEQINHTGCPVVKSCGELTGFITLRDIMKGRRAEQMHAPVKAYMTRKVITASPKATFREMEDLLLTHNIGHLPIVEDGVILGIVTRSDYLAFRREEKELARTLRERLS